MAAAPEGTVYHVLPACLLVDDQVGVNRVDGALFAGLENAAPGDKRAFGVVRNGQENAALTHAPGGVGAVQAVLAAHLEDVRSPDGFGPDPVGGFLGRLGADLSDVLPLQHVAAAASRGSGAVRIIIARHGVMINRRVVGAPQALGIGDGPGFSGRGPPARKFRLGKRLGRFRGELNLRIRKSCHVVPP